jgi:hypothetical protein
MTTTVAAYGASVAPLSDGGCQIRQVTDQCRLEDRVADNVSIPYPQRPVSAGDSPGPCCSQIDFQMSGDDAGPPNPAYYIRTYGHISRATFAHS